MSSPTRPHGSSGRPRLGAHIFTRASARRGLLVALVTVSLVAGCATNKLLDQARLAEQQQDYDRAVLEYGKLVKLHPDDRNIRLALDRSDLPDRLDSPVVVGVSEAVEDATRHTSPAFDRDRNVLRSVATESAPAVGRKRPDFRRRTCDAS